MFDAVIKFLVEFIFEFIFQGLFDFLQKGFIKLKRSLKYFFMIRIFAFVSLVISMVHAQSIYQPQDYVKITHPEWSKNATIYQLNTRQFSQEGTFAAAQKQLTRLKELGVDIIWLCLLYTSPSPRD